MYRAIWTGGYTNLALATTLDIQVRWLAGIWLHDGFLPACFNSLAAVTGLADIEIHMERNHSEHLMYLDARERKWCQSEELFEMRKTPAQRETLVYSACRSTACRALIASSATQ